MKALSGIGFQSRLPIDIVEFAYPAKRREWSETKNMLVFQLSEPANPLRSLDLFIKEPIDFPALLGDSVSK